MKSAQKSFIFASSDKYIAQAGHTRHDTYQKRTLYIVTFLYSTIGALLVILPFIQRDPVFLCKDPAFPEKAPYVCPNKVEACKQDPILIN